LNKFKLSGRGLQLQRIWNKNQSHNPVSVKNDTFLKTFLEGVGILKTEISRGVAQTKQRKYN